MSHSLLLQGSRTQLINQLVYFDEQKKDFLDQYFPNSAKERSKIELLLSVYSAALEKILGEFNEESLNSTVLIGSRMKISYLEDGFTDSYTIVFPHQAEPNSNKISFLSPIGLQLLMAKINETYQLKISSGEIDVKLQEIMYNNCGYL
ncbi:MULTISPECIES: GreA/GreB family elongation factor [unclassified Paenibacillus]|uniref:GreA/GreB family elongation factor n=1 Tax=unclassified Paenibacillus TaxID=185978 RepID=UPI00364001BD